MAQPRRTILHVDDDRVTLHLVRDRLEQQGYQVVSLAEPARTIETLLDNDCRVVMLDVQMPSINGIDLLSQIKEYDGGVQVIMLTGLVSTNTVLESMRRGAEACLFKPISDFQVLLDSLSSAFIKLDRWWETLEDLNRRRAQERIPITVNQPAPVETAL